MQQLKDIRDLQRLGFSLDEIKNLFDDGSHTPTIRQMSVIQIPIE
jgi:DNA-binding transcriptional MerR regulator